MRQHSPFHPSFSRQYRSVIFYRDEYEKEIANEVIASVSASLKGGKVYTSVEPIRILSCITKTGTRSN